MKPHRRFGRRQLVGGLITLLFLCLVVLLPPMYFSSPLSRLTGLTLFWSRLLVGAGWALVLYLAGWGAMYLLRWHKHKSHIVKARTSFDDVMDGLDRLAQGDYNVLIETNDDIFRASGLAERVNNLAVQLSSMEQMRQDFVSNVSHEIQSPLTSIGGFAELLKREDLSREEMLHYVDIIQSEATRMSKLSDSLLRLSLLDSDATPTNPRPFRLDKQIESALLAQEPQWAKKDIELDIALEEVTYLGDEDFLLQVWQNLLQNAIKFTPQGGHIRVTLAETDGFVQCTVEDDGVGIPQEDLVHIFERFYKVDKSRERKMGGNGLGLALAKRITEMHGGHIKVESVPGSGTVFTVCLPVQAEE